jgi:hypothetical protein
MTTLLAQNTRASSSPDPARALGDHPNCNFPFANNSQPRRQRPRLRKALDAHKIRLLALTPRALGLLPVDLVEHGLQTQFEGLVFRALVELADKVPADFEGLEAELEGGVAEILSSEYN